MFNNKIKYTTKTDEIPQINNLKYGELFINQSRLSPQLAFKTTNDKLSFNDFTVEIPDILNKENGYIDNDNNLTTTGQDFFRNFLDTHKLNKPFTLIQAFYYSQEIEGTKTFVEIWFVYDFDANATIIYYTQYFPTTLNIMVNGGIAYEIFAWELSSGNIFDTQNITTITTNNYTNQLPTASSTQSGLISNNDFARFDKITTLQNDITTLKTDVASLQTERPTIILSVNKDNSDPISIIQNISNADFRNDNFDVWVGTQNSDGVITKKYKCLILHNGAWNYASNGNGLGNVTVFLIDYICTIRLVQVGTNGKIVVDGIRNNKSYNLESQICTIAIKNKEITESNPQESFIEYEVTRGLLEYADKTLYVQETITINNIPTTYTYLALLDGVYYTDDKQYLKFTCHTKHGVYRLSLQCLLQNHSIINNDTIQVNVKKISDGETNELA